jgi:hypothetical protein
MCTKYWHLFLPFPFSRSLWHWISQHSPRNWKCPQDVEIYVITSRDTHLVLIIHVPSSAEIVSFYLEVWDFGTLEKIKHFGSNQNVNCVLRSGQTTRHWSLNNSEVTSIAMESAQDITPPTSLSQHRVQHFKVSPFDSLSSSAKYLW